MFFSPLRVDEMEGFVPLVEAVLDERPQHAVLLVGAVEECADMAMPAESASGKVQRIVVVFHASPPRRKTGFDPGRSGGYGNRPLRSHTQLRRNRRQRGRSVFLPLAREQLPGRATLHAARF